jgi:nitroreductase
MSEILMNEVVETILARRSVRKYKPEQITDDARHTIVACGFASPNAMNLQQWFVSIVQDEEVKKEISKGMSVVMVKDPKMPPHVKEMFLQPDFDFSFGAPTVLFVSAPKGASEVDVGIMAANMVDAATSLGLGTCVIGGAAAYLREPEAEEMRTKLQIPEGYEVSYGMLIGYPDEEPEVKDRDVTKCAIIS